MSIDRRTFLAAAGATLATLASSEASAIPIQRIASSQPLRGSTARVLVDVPDGPWSTLAEATLIALGPDGYPHVAWSHRGGAQPATGAPCQFVVQRGLDGAPRLQLELGHAVHPLHLHAGTSVLRLGDATAPTLILHVLSHEVPDVVHPPAR